MNTSKLVNDYVKAKQSEALIKLEIKAQTSELHADLKAQEAQISGLKKRLLEIMETSNSLRVESATNFVRLNVVPVAAHNRNNIIINKE